MRIKIGGRTHYEDQGTDIFVKKIDEGAGYGSGYIVEIYDYGEKVDERKVLTKKDVRTIINEQKARYTTDRAFEEESHLFVSYRIDDIESNKFRKNKDIKVKESEMNIDEKLYKQASKINYLLSVSKEPDTPKKIFKSAEPMFNFNGENSDTQMQTQPAMDNNVVDNADKESIEEASQQIAEKLDAYLTEHQDPVKDNTFNKQEILESYLKDKVIPQLKSRYSDQEVNQIWNTLKSRYKNSDIPGAQEVFYNYQKTASNKIVKRSSGILSDNILSTNQKDNSLDVNNQQTNDLSLDAKNLVDKVNVIKDNPFDIYKTIKEYPNSDQLVQEIQNKQNQTEPEMLVSNYQANYADAIYKFAGEQIVQFSKELKSKKGSHSFNSNFVKWAKLKNYDYVQNYVLNMRKASFIETANYQLNNNNELPTDLFIKQAKEKWVTYYLTRLANTYNYDIGYVREVSPDLENLARNIFYIQTGAEQRTVDVQTPIEQQVETILSSIPEQIYEKTVQQVLSGFLLKVVDEKFSKITGMSGRRDEASYTQAENQIWNDVTTNINTIISQLKEGCARLFNECAMFAISYDPRCKDLVTLLLDRFTGYWNVYFALFVQSDYLVQLLTKIKVSISNKWKQTFINSAKASLFNEFIKYGVNIIINESSDGQENVQIQDLLNSSNDISLSDSLPTTNQNELDNSIDLLDTQSNISLEKTEDTNTNEGQQIESNEEYSMFDSIQDM